MWVVRFFALYGILDACCTQTSCHGFEAERVWRQLPVNFLIEESTLPKTISPHLSCPSVFPPKRTKVSLQPVPQPGTIRRPRSGMGRRARQGTRTESPARTKKDLYEARIEEFERVLSAEVIDLNALRKLALGVCRSAAPRRVLTQGSDLEDIDTRPRTKRGASRSARDAGSTRSSARVYGRSDQSCRRVGRNGRERGCSRNREGSLSTSQVDDDPLSTKSDSVWNKYFADNEVKDQ